MDDDYISINNDDAFTVELDADGYPAVRIQSTAFIERPRWLLMRVAGEQDRATAINRLIAALTELRDNPDGPWE